MKKMQMTCVRNIIILIQPIKKIDRPNLPSSSVAMEFPINLLNPFLIPFNT